MNTSSLNNIDSLTGTPLTIRLPAQGRDPIFGLSRAYYYQAEKEGKIKLIRLRSKSRRRGITLIPVREMHEAIQREGRSQ